MPGIHPPATRATRASWVRSERSASPAPGYWILTATSRPSRQDARCTCPIEAAAAGHVVEGEELRGPPAGAQLGGEDRVHPVGRHRRRGVLEPGQGRAVRSGELLGHRGLHDRQGLAELHGPALELPEDGEELLGGAGLQLGRDELRRLPADPLAEAEGGAPCHPEGQRGEPDGASDDVAGDVGHAPIVAQTVGSRRPSAAPARGVRRPRRWTDEATAGRPRATPRPGSDRAARDPATITAVAARSGELGVGVIRTRSGRADQVVACRSRWPQAGSWSARVRSRHSRQALRPGTTRGPTVPCGPSWTTGSTGTRSD